MIVFTLKGLYEHQSHVYENILIFLVIKDSHIAYYGQVFQLLYFKNFYRLVSPESQ